MPSVPTLISGGISLGILAGFLSSVYYVLVAGIKWIGKLQLAVQSAEEARQAASAAAGDQWSCARCGRPLSKFRIGQGKRIRCAHCSQAICRHCSTKVSQLSSAWICSTCNKIREVQLQTGEWFYEQLRQRFFNPTTVAATSTAEDRDGEVRDFMESVVEGLVGGGLDDICLRPISEHPQYVKFCEAFHEPLALTLARFTVALQMAITDKSLPDSDTPSAVHEELKELVKRIIREAMTLPSFQIQSNGTVEESAKEKADEVEKKSYEDILATAILNKVVERYQQEISKLGFHAQTSVRDANGNVLSRNIRRRRKYKILSGLTAEGSGGGNSTSDSEGGFSVPNSCDDCSWSGSSRTDPLSLTIEECIEEVVTRYSSEEEPDTELGQFLSGLKFKRRQRAPFPEFGMDIVDRRGSSSSAEEGDADGEEDAEAGAVDGGREGVRVSMEVVSPVDSWEENWLFQKRRLKMAGMSQSMPVPMLVPNPSQEYRVLIGDVDVDETSELSECSDSALEDLIDGLEHDPDSSVHSESEHGLENTDAEDEFLMQTYNKNIRKSSVEDAKPNGAILTNGNHNNKVNQMRHSEITNGGNIDEVLTKSSNNPVFNLNEARNNGLVVPQIDSGEGSLEMQQDSEYTEAYDSPAQMRFPLVLENGSSPSDSLECETCTTAISDIKAIENGSAKEKPTIVVTNDAKEQSNQQNGKREDSNIHNNSDDENRENVDIFSAPPRPGTIAEREHLKWQKAVPLSNNPYSRENIERRQRERMLLRRQTSSDTSVEFPELTGENESSVVHIDCSGHDKLDHKQYGRDYYINTDGSASSGNSGSRKEQMRRDSSSNSPDVSTTHVFDENKSQVSVRVEVEVGGRWTGSTPPPTKSGVETRTHVSNVNNQQLLTTVSTSSDRDRQQVTTVSTWSSAHGTPDGDGNGVGDDDRIPLPSVKELAKQFSSTDISTQQVQLSQSPSVLNKRLEVQTSPLRQVHSLTARCISKEFREGLRQSGRPSAYHMKPVERTESSGNISDDSGTASPTPTSNQKLYNSIAFWEQMNMSR